MSESSVIARAAADDIEPSPARWTVVREAPAAGKGSAILIASRTHTFADEALCLRENGYRVDDIGVAQLIEEGGSAADVVIVADDAFHAGLASGVAELRRCVDGALVVVGRRFDEVDEIVALELGADEYLARPFTVRKLLARLRTLKRRRDSAASAARSPLSVTQVAFGPLQLDRTALIATCGGRAMHLSSINFEALFLLTMRAPGVVTRGEMFARLHRRSTPNGSRSVDMFVSRLRRQLKSQGAGVKVATVRSHGYRLEL